MIVVHGFGEHAGRYDAFATELAHRGICVVAPDLWAHGRSGGARGDIGEIRACMEQLRAMAQAAFLPLAGCKDFSVFGHSFGGLLAILWAIERPEHMRRLIVQSPLLETGFEIPWWVRQAALVLARCWPSFCFSMRFDGGALTHDVVVAQAYAKDPLVHQRMSARTYRWVLCARDDVLATTSRLTVPVLMLHAGADRIISTGAARGWFERVRCKKDEAFFPDAYHELHHEPIRDEAARRICAWVPDDEQEPSATAVPHA